MLTDADVDFILIDATNGYAYTERVKDLISVWYEYYELGYDVPRIAVLYDSSAVQTMTTLYNDIYTNAYLNYKYPDLDQLWFEWDGKPMIVGTSSGVSDSIKEYFTIKDSQWPNAARKDNGFPWMEFDRSLKTSSVYGVDG